MNTDIAKAIKTLELDKILRNLSEYAITADAKKKCLSLTPSDHAGTVLQCLKNTEEAYILISRYTAPVFTGAVCVDSSLSRAQVGASLSIKELLDIADTLGAFRALKGWRENSQGFKAESLEPYFESVLPNRFLEEKITYAVKSETELNDHASPALAEIRRNISAKTVRLRDSLDKVIKGASAKYLQEPIITQRDGRFVVPVKAEHRGAVPGLVHDTSATGATLFIEPMSSVEINNEIRVLCVKEQEEINRILAELSAAVADFADSIKRSYKALVFIDFVFAKAKYAFKIKASVPGINADGCCSLINARHPLIPQEDVVPVTVNLGIQYDTMVITGPNTGGKTVTLKTIGLLTVMAMCGMMIPADDGSSVCVFGKIFADIGDEQSIEQSLSTFSSHMIHIISILKQADASSLILLDELCAGTDPVEGAALAKAILMQAASQGAKIVATTHYPELKAYAVDAERVENASCEFDLATLKPTYRLIVGMPGRSNAFAISGKLGLPKSIIQAARDQIHEDDRRFEQVVASLEGERKAAQREHAQVIQLRRELDALKKKSEQDEERLSHERGKILAKTREQADILIERTREQASLLLNQLEDLKKGLTSENAAQRAEEARRQFRSVIRDLEASADPVDTNRLPGESITETPQKGDRLTVTEIGSEATVLEVNEQKKKAYVTSGAMKMWVDFSSLSRSGKTKTAKEIPKTRSVSGLLSKKERKLKREVDLRGMAADEAVLELDKFLNDAILSGADTVTVIHGKGTGVLRQAVRDYLKTQRLVHSYRPGVYGEGEDGVTIAVLTE